MCCLWHKKICVLQHEGIEWWITRNCLRYVSAFRFSVVARSFSTAGVSHSGLITWSTKGCKDRFVPPSHCLSSWLVFGKIYSSSEKKNISWRTYSLETWFRITGISVYQFSYKRSSRQKPVDGSSKSSVVVHVHVCMCITLSSVYPLSTSGGVKKYIHV